MHTLKPHTDGLATIPLLDMRRGGPVEHARARRDSLLGLRDACFSIVPAPLRGLAHPLDKISARWLRKTPSPYIGEIDRIAAIAGRPGVWFVNASYEWGCTTRIDVEPVPRLRRTLDWPFLGLGRHVEVAMQDGGAGPYANVTWPGATGVLTAVAPGRFAAAINQAPMYRRGESLAWLPVDFMLNGIATWRQSARWPAAHLLRHAFDTRETYDEAVALLTTAPVAKPVLISIVGALAGQGCIIERTETEAFVHRGRCVIANDWHPSSPPREGRWVARGTLVRGPLEFREPPRLPRGARSGAALRLAERSRAQPLHAACGRERRRQLASSPCSASSRRASACTRSWPPPMCWRRSSPPTVFPGKRQPIAQPQPDLALRLGWRPLAGAVRTRVRARRIGTERNLLNVATTPMIEGSFGHPR